MLLQRQNFDLFLSYNSRDHEQVEDLARRLRQHRLTLFFDRWYLAPGLRWRPALEDTLTSCRAAVVCVGPNGMGTWQQREIDVALDRQSRDAQFPVIPLLLPGSEAPLGFLRQLTWVDLRSQPLEQGVLVLAKAIRGEPLGEELQQQIEATRAAICPYRGLLYFREEDAPFFFGREAAIRDLVEAVRQKSFLAVVGASGSGKSSVVRAGLVPHLRRDRDTVWEVATLLPGDQPLRSLAAALTPFLEPDMTEIDRLAEVGKLSGYFAGGTVSLGDTISRILAKQSGTDRLLLVADQWEELYTLTQDAAARRRFVDELLDATLHAPVTVVFTLRGDFVGKALAYRLLSDRLQGAQINLGPMTRKELEQAITEPASRMGLSFEPGLAERILDDAGDEPGNLPLLEFVLKELWEGRQGHLLLNHAYDDMDRLAGAIAKRAERFFGVLSPPEQEAVQRLFLQLVRAGADGNDARRREPLANVPDASRQLVKRLADARLLVTAKAAEAAEETAEVAHEALIRNWNRLKDWLNADREFLLWRERLRGLLGEWQRASKSEELLLRGPLLSEAERWLRGRADRLVAPEREFISLSTEGRERRREEEQQRRQRELDQAQALAEEQKKLAEEAARRETAEKERADNALELAKEKAKLAEEQGRLAEEAARRETAEKERAENALKLAEEQKRRARIQTLYAVTATVLLLGCAVLGMVLWTSLRRAETAARSTLAGKLALRSQALLAESDLDLALLLSAHGVCLHDSSENRVVLDGCVAYPKTWAAFLHGHTAFVWSVAFSPDGKTLATGSADKTVRLWDVATCQPLGTPLAGHTEAVTSVAFSPDGKTLATGGEDKTVRLWDVATRQPLGTPLAGHTYSVSSVAFSSDGKTLASGSGDMTVRLWDVATRQPLGTPLAGYTGVVHSVAFSPDGKTLAAGSTGMTVPLWNVATREPLGAPLAGHAISVTSVAFSPDGKTLATASEDKTVLLWDVATRQRLGAPLAGHTESVASVTFSPDGKTLATGGRDKKVLLWDVATRQPLGTPLVGHADSVSSVAFSPDGRTLAAASLDKTVVLWNVAMCQPLGRPLAEHRVHVMSVAFSPDGKTLATGSTDYTARLWDVATRKLLDAFAGHTGVVLSVAFSPDGKTLATGSADNTVQLRDVATRQPLGAPLAGHTSWVQSVAFSPDGKTLATGSADKTVLLWDVATRQPLDAPLAGHTEAVTSVAFSPDGKTLATGSEDKTVLLWDVATRQRLGAPLAGHTESVASVTFSPDGKTLATGGRDKKVLLWDVATRQPLGMPLTGQSEWVWSVAFSPDGKILATGSDDSTVQLWDLDVDGIRFAHANPHPERPGCVNMARRMANRELTEEEVRVHFGDLAKFYEPLWKDNDARRP